MDVDEAIRTRRTTKTYAPSTIARATLEELLQLAVWAPNHRLNEPWRFYVVHSASARLALAEQVRAAFDAMAKPDADEVARARLERKQADMFARMQESAALIWVGTVGHEDPAVERENYAAVACVIHNLTLAAHARGIASYWSTGRPLAAPAVLESLGFDAGTQTLAGVVFLGRDASPGARKRVRTPASELTRWAEA